MYQLTLSTQLLVVLLSFHVSGNNVYQDRLTKLWSLSSARTDSPRTTVLNVTGASIHIEPTSYSDGQYAASTSPSRQSKMPTQFKPASRKYGFRPRPKKEEPSQLERSIHYADDVNNVKKTEILFPGNYFTISEVKRRSNLTEEASFNPLDGAPFHPKIIPLMRGQNLRRSIDEDEEPTIEKPNGYVEPSAMRRSLSYFFGDPEDGDDDEEEEIELDVGDDDELRHKNKKKKIKLKKKYAKYMLPLLLAYKLKFFAMIPLMMGGLVLLVGATGLAGFFFALFAAVMGLQKGSY